MTFFSQNQSIIHLLWFGRSGSARKTVRYMFPLVVLGLVGALGAAVIQSQDASYIRLESSQSVIEAGDRFRITVYAYAHQPVNAVDVGIRLDTKVADLVSVDRGQSVLTLWTEEPKLQNGIITLRGGTFRRGFLGEHEIATIELVARESGSAQFMVEQTQLLAGDGAGSAVAMQNTNEEIAQVVVYAKGAQPDTLEAEFEVAIITDLDGDGTVSLSDLSQFMTNWASRDRTFDFNGDGKMTFRDFSIILADFFFK
jgi:hypothetical protein